MKWLYVAIPLLAFLFIALTEARHEVRRLKGEGVRGYLAALESPEVKAKDAEIADLRNKFKLIAEETGDPMDKWIDLNDQLQAERESSMCICGLCKENQ